MIHFLVFFGIFFGGGGFINFETIMIIIRTSERPTKLEPQKDHISLYAATMATDLKRNMCMYQIKHYITIVRTILPNVTPFASNKLYVPKLKVIPNIHYSQD